MYTIIRKTPPILALFLTLFLFASFLPSSSVLAQEEIEKYGEIAGGRSDSIPIQLKVGQMVQGEIIVRNERLRLSVADFSGKSIYNFGETSQRGGFKYAAETDGQHYLVVTNPDGFSVGTRGYTVKYMIVPADIAPGSGSGEKVTKDVAKSNISWSVIWWIVGIVFVLGIALKVFGGRTRSKRYRPTGRIFREYKEDD